MSGTPITEDEARNVEVHLNIPMILWRAVHAIAEHDKTSITNVVVRALNAEAARMWPEMQHRGDGR